MESNQTAYSTLGFGPEGWGDDLLLAAMLTLELALVSMVFGFLIGAVLALCKLSRIRLIRYLAQIYLLIIRGVPEFLILLLVYFSSEKLINSMLTIAGIDAHIEVPKFAAATAGLSLIFAAYICEILRGAYLSVNKGQIEAANAIGMSGRQVFFRIRLPQLWRFAIPGLGNIWMVILKDTSLAAVIALNELLRVAKLGGETTKEPLLFFIIAGFIYLCMTIVSDVVRSLAEKRATRGFSH